MEVDKLVVLIKVGMKVGMVIYIYKVDGIEL